MAIAPAIAVLAGAGAVAMWDLGRVRKITAWMLPAGVAGSAVWAYVLLDRNPGDYPWLRVAVVVAGLVSAIGLLAARLVLSSALRLTGRSLRRSIVTVMVGLAAAALLAGPLAWSLSTDTHGSNGTNPTAGPVSAETTGFGGFGGSGRHAFGGGSGQGADNRKYEDRVDDDLGGIRRCRLHWVT